MSDSDFGIKIGSAFVFSLIFPGIIGLAFNYYLFDLGVGALSFETMILLTLLIGYVSTVFGMNLDRYLFRSKIPGFNRFPNITNEISYHLEGKLRSKYRSDSSFHINLYIFFFNSSIVLFVSSIVRFLLSFSWVTNLGFSPLGFTDPQVLLGVLALVTSVLSFNCAYFTAQGIVKSNKKLVKKQRLSLFYDMFDLPPDEHVEEEDEYDLSI